RRPALYYALEQRWGLKKLSWLVDKSLGVVLEKDSDGLAIVTHAIVNKCPEELVIRLAVAATARCIISVDELLSGQHFESARRVTRMECLDSCSARCQDDICNVADEPRDDMEQSNFTPYFYVVEIASFSPTFWRRYDQTWWFDKTKTNVIDGMYKVVHRGFGTKSTSSRLAELMSDLRIDPGMLNTVYGFSRSETFEVVAKLSRRGWMQQYVQLLNLLHIERLLIVDTLIQLSHGRVV
ncbi:hypothetical protein PHYSODRAFT_488051, partial [Phytophthora sojae]